MDLYGSREYKGEVITVVDQVAYFAKVGKDAKYLISNRSPAHRGHGGRKLLCPAGKIRVRVPTRMR